MSETEIKMEISTLKSKQEILKILRNYYNEFNKKYKTHYKKYIFSNVFIVVVSSLVIVLNLFALALNEIEGTKVFFVLIAIFTTIGAFFTGLNIVLNISENKKILLNQANSLENIIESLENGTLEEADFKSEYIEKSLN